MANGNRMVRGISRAMRFAHQVLCGCRYLESTVRQTIDHHKGFHFSSSSESKPLQGGTSLFRLFLHVVWPLQSWKTDLFVQLLAIFAMNDRSDSVMELDTDGQVLSQFSCRSRDSFKLNRRADNSPDRDLRFRAINLPGLGCRGMDP